MEAEQQDKVHFLEGINQYMIDEDTGRQLNQNETLVKVYVRSNDQEVKNASILRYFLHIYFTIDHQPFWKRQCSSYSTTVYVLLAQMILESSMCVSKS